MPFDWFWLWSRASCLRTAIPVDILAMPPEKKPTVNSRQSISKRLTNTIRSASFSRRGRPSAESDTAHPESAERKAARKLEEEEEEKKYLRMQMEIEVEVARARARIASAARPRAASSSDSPTVLTQRQHVEQEVIVLRRQLEMIAQQQLEQGQSPERPPRSFWNDRDTINGRMSNARSPPGSHGTPPAIGMPVTTDAEHEGGAEGRWPTMQIASFSILLYIAALLLALVALGSHALTPYIPLQPEALSAGQRILLLKVLHGQRTRITFEPDPAMADALGFCHTPPLMVEHRPREPADDGGGALPPGATMATSAAAASGLRQHFGELMLS